jgi:hypothetical protein
VRRCLRPLLILVVLVLVPLPVWSIIIETKNGETIAGIVVEEDATRIKLRLDATGREVVISRSDVAKIDRVVDPVKLEKLKPDNARAYYLLANEMALHAKDPEARETALRLYVIAADLDPVNLGFESLNRMSLFATSTEEARKYRALAFLLDRLNDKSLLQAKSTTGKAELQSFEHFLQALRMVRRGKTDKALEFAAKPGTAKHFELVPGFLDFPEFLQFCKDHPECSCKTGRAFCNQCKGKGIPNCPGCKGLGWHFCPKCKGSPRHVPLSDNQRELLLRLELEFASNPDSIPTGTVNKDERGWSQLLGGGTMRAVPVLSIQYISDFDPKKCVFKNGAWVAP